MTALAGLVPCAEVGMRQMLRCPSQRLRCQARITSSPVYSPWDPALGCKEIPANPVISASHSSNCWNMSLVATRLPERGKRMQAAELRPRDGQHLRRRVQLHRAGAERDHRSRQRQVARLQPLQVAHHFRLRMIPVEDWLGQILARARMGRPILRISLRGHLSHREGGGVGRR